MADFPHYLEDTTDQAAISSGSDRIRRIHNRVCKVKSNEEIGVKYMQAWEEKYYERQEGLEEELEEDLSDVMVICKAAEGFAPAYDSELIYEQLCNWK